MHHFCAGEMIATGAIEVNTIDEPESSSKRPRLTPPENETSRVAKSPKMRSSMLKVSKKCAQVLQYNYSLRRNARTLCT